MLRLDKANFTCLQDTQHVLAHNKKINIGRCE